MKLHRNSIRSSQLFKISHAWEIFLIIQTELNSVFNKLNFKASSLKPPAAPKHLERPEQSLWKEIVATYRFDDAGALTMLRTALEAHQRARRCRERIDADGEAILDRWGQLKPHPLLAAERDARAALLSGLKALNLDLGVNQ